MNAWPLRSQGAVEVQVAEFLWSIQIKGRWRHTRDPKLPWGADGFVLHTFEGKFLGTWYPKTDETADVFSARVIKNLMVDRIVSWPNL